MKTDKKSTALIILETRQPGKDGTYPVKLRIFFEGSYRDWIMKFPTAAKESSQIIDRLQEAFKGVAGQSIRMTKEDFNKVTGKEEVAKIIEGKEVKLKNIKSSLTRETITNFRTLFQSFEEEARNTISGITDFSFELFASEHFTNRDKKDLFAQMATTAKRLRTEGRISTAITFECALNSLRSYTGKDKLPFESITVSFLKKYQEWMTAPIIKDAKVISGNSLTTVGMYLRNVRTMFNEANLKGLVYPFGRGKNGLYQIPKGRNVKKALTQQQVASIAAYNCAGTYEHRSRDLWLFSYLCNGINIKDIARLIYSSIIKDSDGNAKISLIRAKTAESVDNTQPIEIIVTKQIGRIIDKWGNKPASPNQYIFPILSPGMSPELEYRAIQQAVQTINKNMKRICEDMEMDPVTTYTARHSFATVLKRSGASIEFISESLGHRNKLTTQNYLANFEDDEKRKWAEMLLPDPEQ